MIQCPICSAENESDEQFCIDCGQKLPSIGRARSSPIPPAVSQEQGLAVYSEHPDAEATPISGRAPDESLREVAGSEVLAPAESDAEVPRPPTNLTIAPAEPSEAPTMGPVDVAAEEDRLSQTQPTNDTEDGITSHEQLVTEGSPRDPLPMSSESSHAPSLDLPMGASSETEATLLPSERVFAPPITMTEPTGPDAPTGPLAGPIPTHPIRPPSPTEAATPPVPRPSPPPPPVVPTSMHGPAIQEIAQDAAMVCPACNKPGGDRERFCSDCGARLIAMAPRSALCPSCSTPVDPSDRFCKQCGERLPAASATLVPRLVMVSTGGQERVYPLTGSELTIGRAPQNDIPLTADLYVSSRHARVFTEEEKVFLEDVESTNGTFLRVRDRAELAEGDEIKIGQSILRFHK